MARWQIKSSAFPLSVLGIAGIACSLSCSPQAPIAASAALYERPPSVLLYDIAAVRGEVRPLRLHRDGDEYECALCHDGFPNDKVAAELKDEHTDLEFNHGLNLRCLSCHHPANSMAYVNHDGSEIPAEQPAQLCAKCHGLHYQEWMLGVHGRVNGHWDESLGEQKKLDCVQCHDAHHPRFQIMTPDPPLVLTRFEALSKGVDVSGK